MESSKLKISVIGCGWLGMPLCHHLVKNGFEVISTTTTKSKLANETRNFELVLFDVTKMLPSQSLTLVDVIIYNIPPLGLGEVEKFFNTINPTLTPVPNIIFISSTSVYGKSLGPINEDSELSPTSKNGNNLKITENYLRSRFKKLTILRPGGLIGEDRHPIHFLKGKSGLTSGKELLHLVHRDDCIESITQIIKKQIWNEDINLVNDIRIQKEVYYTKEALKLGLVPPQYINNPEINPTNISNEKAKNILGIQFK
jgi:nucleoside-diphosphate-sugar epimerase